MSTILQDTTLLIALCFALVGCSPRPDLNQAVRAAAAIEADDTCHLCGMSIMAIPGPKGEWASKGDPEVRKFCSTLDLFTFYLQPENSHRTEAIYVHDMTLSPWTTPDDDHFIKAQDAWYVWGSNQQGAMGPALASFGGPAAALAFIDAFGGQLYRFADISLALLLAGVNSPMAMPVAVDTPAGTAIKK
jgi:copper chaperone NosL